jgi:hypothetical protein
MGTSTDRHTGSGGAWTPLKHAATAYAKAVGGGPGNPRETAQRVLTRHVDVLGGASGAASTARAGGSALAGLGGFLGGVGGVGLAAALTEAGLADLVGKDRWDVLDGLITLIAGDASDIESQAARDAMSDVCDELYGDAESWEELEAVQVSAADLETLLEEYLARYIYNRVPVLAERLAQILDPAAARDADHRIVQMIRDLVSLQMPENPFVFDWRGQPGRDFANTAIRDVYDALATEDPG